jgi:hypothetical protein
MLAPMHVVVALAAAFAENARQCGVSRPPRAQVTSILLSVADGATAKEKSRDLYKELRGLSAARLWNEEVPRFQQLAPSEREAHAAVVRAVGVKMANTRDATQRTAAREWMLSLLDDPSERVRRYALGALPKIGGDPAVERALLQMLRQPVHGDAAVADRERRNVAAALEKLGSAEALAVSSRLALARLLFRARTARRTHMAVGRALAAVSPSLLAVFCLLSSAVSPCRLVRPCSLTARSRRRRGRARHTARTCERGTLARERRVPRAARASGRGGRRRRAIARTLALPRWPRARRR